MKKIFREGGAGGICSRVIAIHKEGNGFRCEEKWSKIVSSFLNSETLLLSIVTENDIEVVGLQGRIINKEIKLYASSIDYDNCLSIPTYYRLEKDANHHEGVNVFVEKPVAVSSEGDFLNALTVEDARLDLQNDLVLSTLGTIHGNATINLNGHKLSNSTVNARVLEVASNSSLILKDGTVEGSTSGANPVIFIGKDSKIKIDNCTLTNTTDKDVLKTNGTDEGISIEVNNSIINGRSYLPADGQFVFNNCEISGRLCALYLKSGKLIINGGTFKSNGTDGDWAHSSNGYFSTGEAIVVESCNYPGKVPEVTLLNNPVLIPGVPAEGALYNNYGLLAIAWRKNESGRFIDPKVVSDVPYRLGRVTGYDKASGPYYHFNDDNTELIK